MTPTAFIAKWKAAELKESAAAQSHFNDLCAMLGEPTPTEADPKGEWYAFEKGATKTTGGEGWADVWKRRHFGWEYKGKNKSLDKAFAQLQQYALALENPPLLVVCDLDRFRIHTNWTNTVSEVHEFTLDDLADPKTRQKLKWVFSDPEKLRPQKTRQKLTEEVATQFAALAHRLRARGHPAETVAHFVNRLIFCMFAEDVKLLPNKLFTKMLKSTAKQPDQFARRASELFKAMKAGGEAAWETIDWFNGGLFDDDTALPLDEADIAIAIAAAEKEWEEIDPSILGTLFERGLDPDKRSQLGAHYTDRDKIMLIIEPVIIRPWLSDWETTKAAIVAALDKEKAAKSPSAKTRAHGAAKALVIGFLDRLRAFRVLDPACGSGNFLYLALLALKDLEHRVSIEAEALGFQRELPMVGPSSVKGIEINPYAAELARVSVWVGEIQWMLRNGFGVSRNPILKPLDNIECRDALFPADPKAPWPDVAHLWPEADAIIGNPPFLGDKAMIGYMGEAYVQRLRAGYAPWLPGGSDLVCYWFAIADRMLREGRSRRVGFVATNSIRGGANRTVLDRICEHHVIFDAWSDEDWTLDGAAVRVSLVCFGLVGAMADGRRHLNREVVREVFADLTSGDLNLTAAARLRDNRSVAFQGPVLVGNFDVPGEMVRSWLSQPMNVNGKHNNAVLFPLRNGRDLNSRPRDFWVISFGSMNKEESEFFEKPFEHVIKYVKPERDTNRRERRRIFWWRHGDLSPKMNTEIKKLTRYIATSQVSKHRFFVWMDRIIWPHQTVITIARDDYTSFGIVGSRWHIEWATRKGSWLGVGNDPRYTPTTTFETFPFPEGLTPNIPASAYADDPRAIRIALAAKRLDELREAWLNPPDLVKRVPEVVPGYPDRLLPVDEKAAATLKKRTLTNLYNERPAWLDNAHRELDRAVAAAYGWPEDIAEDDALARLLDLNRERAAAGR